MSRDFTFTAALAELGSSGRTITRLAAPVGERVDAFLDLPAQAQPITINLTLNIISAPEEPSWPIN